MEVEEKIIQFPKCCPAWLIHRDIRTNTLQIGIQNNCQHYMPSKHWWIWPELFRQHVVLVNVLAVYLQNRFSIW